MVKTDLQQALAEIDFLQGVAPDDLRQIANVSRVVSYETGDVIFREGEPAAHLYLIMDGRISVEICAPGVGCRRILTVGTGEMLGWSAVLQQTQLTATARALAPTHAIEINAGQVIALGAHNPQLGYELMRRAALALAKRLSATRLQLLDVYGHQMPNT